MQEFNSLAGRVALVTGASSGIGRAIALALARHGVRLCLVGREPGKLAATCEAVRQFTKVESFRIDLTSEGELDPLFCYLERGDGGLDILIHSAGVVHLGRMALNDIANLDAQYATNVRAPYLLTQRLLPLLSAQRGQVVFINSSAGICVTKPETGQYAATKHALKAIADSLRAEINSQGVRVLTMYLGRTATPMQEALYRQQGTAYEPELLLQPEDVASLLVYTLGLPASAEVTEISMRPVQKSY